MSTAEVGGGLRAGSVCSSTATVHHYSRVDPRKTGGLFEEQVNSSRITERFRSDIVSVEPIEFVFLRGPTRAFLSIFLALYLIKKYSTWARLQTD